MGHIVSIARGRPGQPAGGMLARNAPMLAVFRRSGLPMATRVEGGVVHARLSLNQDAEAVPRGRHPGNGG